MKLRLVDNLTHQHGDFSVLDLQVNPLKSQRKVFAKYTAHPDLVARDLFSVLPVGGIVQSFS